MTFKNTFGHILKMHSFGESHGKALGVVIDGLPSGIKVNETWLQNYLHRRRPGQSAFVSERQETDTYEILSGVYDEHTLGTPVSLIFYNKDQRSEDYAGLKPRQGHADQTWIDKFSHVDLRGGGRSSGRETVARVAAGAFARMLLQQINPQLQIHVWVDQIGMFKNTLPHSEFAADFDEQKGLLREFSFPEEVRHAKLRSLLLAAKEEGESYGGRVSVKILNLDPGLGQPVFSKLKADLASALFSIGAVTAVNLGDANVFEKGSQYHRVQQNYGGIQGGISSGNDIDLEILFKPTSSIMDVAKRGRHDPCILPRAVVVVEAMLAMVLADHYLLKRLDNI